MHALSFGHRHNHVRICMFCNAVFDSKHGLSIHLARWCGEAERECYEKEFEVQEILSARGSPEYRFYHVLWKGYPLEQSTWEPARFVDNCEAVDDFWADAGQCFSIVDHLPEQPGEHRCTWCCKFYKRHQDLKSHLTRGCKCAPRSKVGGKAEAAVKKAKMARVHSEEQHVTLHGKPLQNSFNFKYLGFIYQADGKWEHAVRTRMALARARFGKMHNLWNSSMLTLEIKLQLYACAVVSVLVYGCEAWWLTDSMLRALNGWNARCLSIITGRNIREEATEPSYHLVNRIRTRRLRWLGHVLRESEGHLVRQVLTKYIADKLNDYPAGSILMDAPIHVSLDELVELAYDREQWNLSVNAISWVPVTNSRKRKL